MIEITTNCSDELTKFLGSPKDLESCAGKTCWIAVSKDGGGVINGAIVFGSTING